jgi:hypothetical protein
MKKFFMVAGLLCISLSLFAQSIDKSQYKAIDLLSYEVEGEKEGKDYTVKYKMVLYFGSHSGMTVYFKDTEGNLLLLETNKKWSFIEGHAVTVYFTAEHRSYGAWMNQKLIDIEPHTNSGVKAYIDECVSLVGKPVPSGFKRTDRSTYKKTIGGDQISLIVAVEDNIVKVAIVGLAFDTSNLASQFLSYFYTFFEDNKWEYLGSDADAVVYEKNNIMAFISNYRREDGKIVGAVVVEQKP